MRLYIVRLLGPDLKEFGTSADQILGVVYESVCPLVRSYSDWIVLRRAGPTSCYHDFNQPLRGKVHRGWPAIYPGPNVCLAKGKQAPIGVCHRSGAAQPGAEHVDSNIGQWRC